jgi:hypothetical protein
MDLRRWSGFRRWGNALLRLGAAQTPIRSDTLANLLASGTNDGVAVGDVAWDTTNLRWLYCKTVAASTSVWRFKCISIVNAGAVDTASSSPTLLYMAWQNEADSTSIAGARIGAVMHSPGRVISVGLLCSADLGATTIGVHVDENTTPVATGAVTFTAVNQARVAVMSPTTEHWTGGANGSEISISTVTANTGNIYAAYVVLELDVIAV